MCFQYSGVFRATIADVCNGKEGPRNWVTSFVSLTTGVHHSMPSHILLEFISALQQERMGGESHDALLQPLKIFFYDIKVLPWKRVVGLTPSQTRGNPILSNLLSKTYENVLIAVKTTAHRTRSPVCGPSRARYRFLRSV